MYINKWNTVSYKPLKVFLQSCPIVVVLYSSALNIYSHCNLLNVSGTCIIPGSTPLPWYLCSAVGFVCVVALVTLKARLGQVGFQVHKKWSSSGDIISVPDVIVWGCMCTTTNQLPACPQHWTSTEQKDLTPPLLFVSNFKWWSKSIIVQLDDIPLCIYLYCLVLM